jgi:hypothetical protein
MPLIERISCGGVRTLSPGSSAEAMAVLIHAAAILTSFSLPWTLRQCGCSMDWGRLPCRKDARSSAVCISAGGLVDEHRPRPVPFVPASHKYGRRCDDGPVQHTPTSVPNAPAQRSDKPRPAGRVALLQRLQLGPAAPGAAGAVFSAPRLRACCASEAGDPARYEVIDL